MSIHTISPSLFALGDIATILADLEKLTFGLHRREFRIDAPERCHIRLAQPQNG